LRYQTLWKHFLHNDAALKQIDLWFITGTMIKEKYSYRYKSVRKKAQQVRKLSMPI